MPNIKSHFRSRLISSSAIVAALAMPALAAAQDSSDEPVATNDVITVTATRRDESIIDAPVSVSVVDNDAAISAGVVDINALADFSPGLSATDGGSPGLGNLVIRGLYAGGAPTVGTYIDDVPYGAVVGSFAANTALDASLYDLDRVEIVRGPQGTLFGASSVGGVVRYVTRDPNLEEIEGYGFIDLSNTQDGGDTVLVRGRASVPLIQDRVAVSLSGYSQDSGGYIDSGVGGGSDIDNSEFHGLRFEALVALSDRATIEASHTYHEASFDSASYETFNPVTNTPLFGPLQTEFAAPRALDFELTAVNAEFEFGFATLSSITSVQTSTIVNTTDITATLGGVADALAPGGAPHTVGFSSGDDTDRFSQEIRLTSRSEGRTDWIFGAFYTKQESNSYQITDVTPNDIELVTLNGGQEFTEMAFFGNLTYALTPNWEITGGFRWSDTDNDVDQAFSGALSNPLLTGLRTSQGDQVTTWLFNTRYRINDQTNLYARIASGYRPGGANLVVVLGPTTLGTPTFQPDNLWSYEAGIKGIFPNTDLIYDVGAYVVEWSDAQIAVTNAAGLGNIGNTQNEVSALGLEASVSGELVENFFVSGTVAVTETSLDGAEPALNAAAGESLPGIPDLTASLTGDYVKPLSNGFELTVGGSWRYTGRYTMAFNGSPTGNYTNQAYSQFDIRAGIRRNNVTLQGYIANVTEEDAYQTVFGVAPGFAYGVPLRPRTVGVNLRVDF